MSKISITLQPEIDLRAVEYVRSSLDRVGHGDEIDITVESADAHQADPVIDLLDRNGFDYQSSGSHDGHYYHIKARRKVH